MNSATLFALYLLALEPGTIDPATRTERIQAGQAIRPDQSAPMYRRAISAGQSIAERISSCFHPTAQVTGWRYAGPWSRAWEEGADHAGIVEIDYRGMSGQRYRMAAALSATLYAPDQRARVFLLADNAVIPARKECEFNEWQAVSVDLDSLAVSP